MIRLKEYQTVDRVIQMDDGRCLYVVDRKDNSLKLRGESGGVHGFRVTSAARLFREGLWTFR